MNYSENSSTKQFYIDYVERKKMNKKLRRYNALYNDALNRYLDKTDWDYTEWLLPENVEEFCNLNMDLFNNACVCGKHE